MSGKELAKQEDALQKASDAAPASREVTYICGNCGLDVTVKPDDAIRCRECGYRILFKKRCKKPMQYQAI